MKSFLVVLTLSAITIGPAQIKIMHGDGKQHVQMKIADDAFILRELGAAIASDEGAMKVLNVMPPDQRPSSYKDVDLQQDDIIVMANGKRLANIKDIKSIYEGLSIGDEFKLGIKRNDEMHLVSLKKGDPKDLPNLQMKVIHGGNDDNAETFPAVGVVMKMKGKDIVIDELLPGETSVKNADVKAGDVLVSMNKRQLKTLSEYSEAFDEVGPGKNVTWVLRRGGSEHTVSFNRPQPKMMIKREGPKP